MRLARALIGLLSIVAGAAFFTRALQMTKEITVTHNSYFVMTAVLMSIWIIFSIISKLGMIFESASVLPNWLAVFAWVIFVITLVSYVYGTPGIVAQTGHITQVDTVLGTLFLVGWPIIDVIDGTFLRPV